jgi:hypothetical protein
MFSRRVAAGGWLEHELYRALGKEILRVSQQKAAKGRNGFRKQCHCRVGWFLFWRSRCSEAPDDDDWGYCNCRSLGVAVELWIMSD